MSLFLDPDTQRALVRQAQAERTRVIASWLKDRFTWTRRASLTEPRPTPALLEKIRAVVVQYWALPLSRS